LHIIYEIIQMRCEMKRIIGSLILVLFLQSIFGCKESKAGQESSAKDNTAVDGDSNISEKVAIPKNSVSLDTLSTLIVNYTPNPKDFDFKIAIMQGEKTIQVIPYSYPKDDETYLDPMGGRKDSCRIADVTFDGNKDLLVRLGQFGNQGVEYWDAYIWNEEKKKFIITPSFREIPNPTINEKDKVIESFSRGSAADYEYGKWVFKNGKFVEISHKSEHLNRR